MYVKRNISLLLFLLTAVIVAVAQPQVSFSGFSSEVIDITPDKNTGLDHIYVARSVQGLVITAPAVNGKPLVSWQQYDNRGGGFATEVENLSTEGNNTILRNPKGDTGYILTWEDAKCYFWLTDYSQHQLQMESIELPVDNDCGMTTVTLTGEGAEIHYYSITGRQLTLSREINVSYNTLVWNQEECRYDQTEQRKEVEGVGQVFISPPPLCNTVFIATGDRFLKIWNVEQQVESALFNTNAVEVNTSAERTNLPGEGSNQIGSGQDSEELGGSAPADISFKAFITDAVLHCEWQFASDPLFEDIIMRFNQQDLDYTFNDEGVTYVRFVGSNSDGSCSSEGETYTVQIGASELRCPNAFSPGASEGINDEWKVSYRSLIDFKCWIFDRYGTQLFYFDDPEKGWDGKYRGKYVSPGVYFYVIEAKGSDGKHYKKGGDINILRYKINGTGTSGSGAE